MISGAPKRFSLVSINSVVVADSFTEFPAKVRQDFIDSGHALSRVGTEAFIEDFGGANVLAEFSAVENEIKLAVLACAIPDAPILYLASFIEFELKFIGFISRRAFKACLDVAGFDFNLAAIDEELATLLTREQVPDNLRWDFSVKVAADFTFHAVVLQELARKNSNFSSAASSSRRI